jgi:hypothetical protein
MNTDIKKQIYEALVKSGLKDFEDTQTEETQEQEIEITIINEEK